MEVRSILALVIAIPVILFPVVFAWFVAIGHIYVIIRDVLKRRAERKHGIRETALGQVTSREFSY